MKKVLLLICIVLISWVLVSGDIYIKMKTHQDSFYDKGTTVPAQNSIEEHWIGDQKMAFITENLITIYDLEKNQMIFINQIKKIYAETPIPLDMSNLVTAQYYSRLQMLKPKGTIKKTNETKKIGEWNCRKYEIEIEMIDERGRHDVADLKVWITEDVPFDLEMYGKIISNVLKIENYDDDLISEWIKIKGFQIALERTLNIRGSARKYYEEVVEISKKNPPVGIYAVPAGYTKKEKLSGQDF